MTEKKLELDPRLQGIHRSVVMRVYSELIEPSLMNQQLLVQENEPAPPLTDEGFELLLKNLVTSVGIALARAEINVPEGYAVDEVELTDVMVRNFGVATLGLLGNDIHLEFDGKGALVKSITTPLDVDKALAARPEGDYEVGHVEIGKRPRIHGTEIIDIFDPNNRLDVKQ